MAFAYTPLSCFRRDARAMVITPTGRDPSIRAFVETSAAQDHRHTPLRPRRPRLLLLRTRDVQDVGLPSPRRERFECRPQLRRCIQPGLQLRWHRIRGSLLEAHLLPRLLDSDGFV